MNRNKSASKRLGIRFLRHGSVIKEPILVLLDMHGRPVSEIEPSHVDDVPCEALEAIREATCTGRTDKQRSLNFTHIRDIALIDLMHDLAWVERVAFLGDICDRVILPVDDLLGGAERRFPICVSARHVVWSEQERLMSNRVHDVIVGTSWL